MATARKDSSSKGGVTFPGEEDDAAMPPDSPAKAHPDQVISAVPEPDGTYLVKVGFLTSHHRYEIVFDLPQLPGKAGKDAKLFPALRTSAKPRLRATRITPRQEGGVKVVCEYTTLQEGVLQEELTLVDRSRRDGSVRVKLQAKVMDRSSGTPTLKKGVRCIGPEQQGDLKKV